MNEYYWKCNSCEWKGYWGEAQECLDENWEGETTFHAYCPKCNDIALRIYEREDPRYT